MTRAGTYRVLGVAIAAFLATNSPAVSGIYELDTSFTERAKLKSFGVENWVGYDPTEIKRGQPIPDEGDWHGSNRTGTTFRILDLIAFAEAGPKNYDAVHFGAKRKTPKKPTLMTVSQIQEWVRATPGQPHAIGRYQFIPSTFNRLIRHTGTSGSTRFSPALQDRLATVLLVEAGHTKFTTGKLSLNKYMDRLARVWAGLPKKNGRSHYHKYAGNYATISRKFFLREMKRIIALN